MGLLVGGVAGASQRLGGGLSSNAVSMGEVRPLALQQPRRTLSPTQPGQAVGKLIWHVNGLTTDALNAPLAGATVLIFDWATKLLVGSMVSDAAGNYDLPVYTSSTTYFIYADKAGSPEVFGASSSQVVPV